MTPRPVQRSFPLDASILTSQSAATVEVASQTAEDVLLAFLNNAPLPARELNFGSIDLGASIQSVAFHAGPGTVGFSASAGFQTGVALWNSAASAIGSLQLAAPPALDLTVGGPAGERYLAGVFRYNAAGSFQGSQPIGAVGTLTFGAQGSASGLLAVIHGFDAATPAPQAFGDTFASLRLPRHVTAADQLAPRTWIIGETDGSIGLQIAASLGYDLNFVRKLNLLNTTRNLSAKIDAAVKATFGFTVSGRYLVVIGREDAGTNVRLRIFKQAQNGMTFGLNAGVGVQFAPVLPKNPDDLVKSIFGVQALQVVQDLREWSDPNTDLGTRAARLVLSEAKDLIRNVTGVDPDTELAAGHKILMDAIAKWRSLPGEASSAFWNALGKLDAKGADAFRAALTGLADPDPQTASAALTGVLENALFGSTAVGQFLGALGGQGLLALRKQIPTVQQAAGAALDLLNAGTLAKLQKEIEEKLDLQKVLDATDPAQIDGWMQKRLADFFDRTLDLPELKQVQAEIRSVIDHAQSIYAAALRAATSRYSAELAVTYQRAATGEALADVVFDMSTESAAAELRKIMESGSIDSLFVDRVDGVSVNAASLSHEISRNTTVSVHLPYFDSKTEHINVSKASLAIEHDSGSVLVYQLDATDKVKKKRYLSQMQVFARIADGAVMAGSTISYQTLLAQPRMSRAELAFRTEPFLRSYLGKLFPSLDAYYTNLDNTVENVLHNGGNEFGNALINLQLALPASLLAVWLNPMPQAAARAATMRMSIALQRRMREILPLFYFQRIENLRDDVAAAALLTWAALPLSTSASWDPPKLTINTDRDVFWDWRDIDLRHAMAAAPMTQNKLVQLLAAAQRRLAEAGLKRADDFDPQRVNAFQTAALRDDDASNPASRLAGLLQTEAILIDGAAQAFLKLQEASAEARRDPSTAIEALAQAGASLTETFHRAVSPNYGEDASRTLNSLLLVEATQAIAPAPNLTPDAMFSLIVLNENTSYDVTKFLTGDLPATSDVALTQTLVS